MICLNCRLSLQMNVIGTKEVIGLCRKMEKLEVDFKFYLTMHLERRICTSAYFLCTDVSWMCFSILCKQVSIYCKYIQNYMMDLDCIGLYGAQVGT